MKLVIIRLNSAPSIFKSLLLIHSTFPLELFRGPYVDRAKYYNPRNPGQHMNMSDAFELRLFRAPIVKISNPQDLDIREIYSEELAANPLKPIVIQQQYEYDLMEYESELWEY